MATENSHIDLCIFSVDHVFNTARATVCTLTIVDY